MMGLRLLVFVVSTACIGPVVGYPQCLNLKPPFGSSESFTTCTEHKSFGCCTAADDLEITQKYNDLIQNVTQEVESNCGQYLKIILCQKCSPYGARIYDVGKSQKARTILGLCPSYCNKMMKTCAPLIGMIIKDVELIGLSQMKNPSKFCQAVKPTKNRFCYPNVQRFERKIDASEFFGRGSLLVPSQPECVPMCVEEVASGLRNPLSLKHTNDGTHRMFVLEQLGIVWIYLPDRTKLPLPFMNLTKIILINEEQFDEKGVLDIEFHPNYKENGLFYIIYSVLINEQHHIKISEMKVSDEDMNRANLTSERMLFTVAEPGFNHNGGQLLFGEDNYLYIFTGDGGDLIIDNGQNKKTLLGKILRIDVNSVGSDGKPYAIPPDNPFVGDADYLPEIYALGVRNMWRCGVDRGDAKGRNRGRIFCGDSGEDTQDEIDIVVKGGNYGWKVYEGNHCHNESKCGTIEGYVPPIHAYDETFGRSVIGGHMYRGCMNPKWKGKYIFGDFVAGKLAMLQEARSGRWREKEVCMAAEDVCKNIGFQNIFARFILAFGEDEAGEVYMLSTQSPIPGEIGGSVYRLVDPRRASPKRCKSDIERGTQEQDRPLE